MLAVTEAIPDSYLKLLHAKWKYIIGLFLIGTQIPRQTIGFASEQSINQIINSSVFKGNIRKNQDKNSESAIFLYFCTRFEIILNILYGYYYCRY